MRIAAAHICGVRAERQNAAERQPALDSGKEAVALARRAGDDYVLAVALNNLGHATVLLGDLEQGKAFWEESLEVRRRIGDLSRIAVSLSNLGWLAFSADDLDRAAELNREAAEIASKIGDKRNAANALSGLGWIAYREERWGEAETHAREALRLAREIGAPRGILDPMFCLAGVAASSGDGHRAARLAAAAELHDTLIPNADETDRTRNEELIERVRAACDPKTWERASAEGRMMSLEEAAELALSHTWRRSSRRETGG